jgi:hypothetical protein
MAVHKMLGHQRSNDVGHLTQTFSTTIWKQLRPLRTEIVAAMVGALGDV